MNLATTARIGVGPPATARAAARPGGPEAGGEVEALKLLLVAMWRELSALEASEKAAGAGVDLPLELRRFESDLIRCALIRTAGRQRRAARLLGMSVATLNAKIKRYRIDADEMLKQAAALRLKNQQGVRDVEE